MKATGRRYVVQQILDGWTEMRSSNGRLCSAIADPQSGLDWAVREVARRAGDVAAEEIARLELGITQREKRIDSLREEIDRLNQRTNPQL